MDKQCVEESTVSRELSIASKGDEHGAEMQNIQGQADGDVLTESIEETDEVTNMSIDESSVLSDENMDQSHEHVNVGTKIETIKPETPDQNTENIENISKLEDNDSSSNDLEKVERKESSDIVSTAEAKTSPISQNQNDIGSSTDARYEDLYYLKWFDWKGIPTPIITQNENGPCPLLAIANVLILARKIELPSMQQIVSGKQIMEYIGDCILSSAPEQDRDNEELILNYQQNMQVVADSMYKLQTGVCDFEFTQECIVFKLLKIALYHGWLVDPQDTPAVNAIDNLSYNQIIDKMLSATESTDENLVIQGLAIKDFLERTASQLTYHGLCELNRAVEEEDLCVFFRNNHFSTLYKRKEELFLLVTDQGLLTEPTVIWETLANIEGDSQFVNSEFINSEHEIIQLDSNTVPPLPPRATSPHLITQTAQPTVDSNLTQEYHDYLIALSLQQECNSPLLLTKHGESGVSSTQQNRIGSDHVLALQLQEDKDLQIRQEQHQQRQAQQAAATQQIQTDSASPPMSTAATQPQQQQPAPPNNSQRNQRSEQQDNEKCTIQ